MAVTRFIAYYRLSKDSATGENLGLDSQKSQVERLASQSGATIVASYSEVMSGANEERPELRRALLHAKRIRGTLLVAKLDRASRSFIQLVSLLEGNVPVVCAEMPQADKNMLRIRAVFSAWELDIISQRIKGALAEKKKQGVLLGSARPNHWAGKEHLRLAGLAKGRPIAAKVLKQQADDAYADLLPTIVELREGNKTLQQICDYLNESGHQTRRGKQFRPQQIKNILNRKIELVA